MHKVKDDFSKFTTQLLQSMLALALKMEAVCSTQMLVPYLQVHTELLSSRPISTKNCKPIKSSRTKSRCQLWTKARRFGYNPCLHHHENDN